MPNLLRSLSDVLLAKFLPAVDAGACVPENGQCCGCAFGYQYRIACKGACRQTSLRCNCAGCPGGDCA